MRAEQDLQWTKIIVTYIIYQYNIIYIYDEHNFTVILAYIAIKF